MHSQVNISAANLQSSRQTFGSFGSPSLANGSFGSSLGQSINNRYQRAGTKAFNDQAERSGPGYATFLASRSGATNVANEVRKANISLEKQEIALDNLRREQIEYYDKQTKLQVQEKLQCEKVQNAQPSQQSKNSTSSFLQNSDSSVSKLSSHNIPVVPRRSKTPPCLNGRGIDESILPNQNDQDKGLSRSYANIKFPPSAPSASNRNNNPDLVNTVTNITTEKPK